MREVAIVGAGMTRFGELWQQSLRDMFVEAAAGALTDAGADHVAGRIPTHSSQNDAHARHQFTRTERLGDVIVCA